MANFDLIPLTDIPDSIVRDLLTVGNASGKPILDLDSETLSSMFVIRANEAIPEYEVNEGDFGGIVEGPDTFPTGGKGWMSHGAIALKGSTISPDTYIGPGLVIMHSTIDGDVAILGKGIVASSTLDGHISLKHAEITISKSTLHGSIVSDGYHLSLRSCSTVPVKGVGKTSQPVTLNGECSLRDCTIEGGATIVDSMIETSRLEGDVSLIGATARGAQVLDSSFVAGDIGPGAITAGRARVLKGATVREGTRVSQDAIVAGHVRGPADISGHAYISTEGRVSGPVSITDNVIVEGVVDGLVTATGHTLIDRMAHVKADHEGAKNRITLTGHAVIRGDLAGPAHIDSAYHGPSDLVLSLSEPATLNSDEETIQGPQEALNKVGGSHGPML